MILPRWWKSAPSESNSRLYQPTAAPTISRPLEMWSMVASSLASSTGLRIGSTRMPVPILILVVRAAIAVRMISASWIGKFGSTPSRMWSHAHSDS